MREKLRTELMNAGYGAGGWGGAGRQFPSGKGGSGGGKGGKRGKGDGKGGKYGLAEKNVKSNRLCFAFHDSGSCRFGSECTFSHEEAAHAGAAASGEKKN